MKTALTTILLVFLSACAVGLEPPEPTEMVLIDESLEYVFGTTLQCRDGEIVQCEAEKEITFAFPVVTLSLEPFYIDEHEVTNLQYQYCVATGVCTLPKAESTMEDNFYYSDDQNADYPVVNVTFEQARIYCASVGKRLPEEYEWERVAKGPDLSAPRVYPSDSFPNSLSNCQTGVALNVCNGRSETEPVKSSGSDFVTEANGKIYDMAGNVSEWTSSFYEGNTTVPVNGNGELNWVTCKETLPSDCNSLNCPTGPDQARCLSRSASCAACVVVEGEISPCFVLCGGDDGVADLPICIPHDPDDLILPVDLWPTLGGKVITRGGNYNTKQQQACGIRSAFRGFYRSAGADGDGPTVGFRCARDN